MPALWFQASQDLGLEYLGLAAAERSPCHRPAARNPAWADRAAVMELATATGLAVPWRAKLLAQRLLAQAADRILHPEVVFLHIPEQEELGAPQRAHPALPAFP